MTPTLYRMHDQFGNLLYVGRTINPIGRLHDHRLGKDWWNDVAAIFLEQFDTLDELSQAEARAIENERPIHNRAGGSLRTRIAKIGLQIDELYDNPRGTSLKALYSIYWPPEQCTFEEFGIVHQIALDSLRVARLRS